MKKPMLFTVILFVLFTVVACGSSATPAPSAGINGTWRAPAASASLEVTLQSAASCQAAQPCVLTGTFKDNRQGWNGPLGASTLTGSAVHLTGISGVDHDLPFVFDGTLGADGLKMQGTYTAQNAKIANPEILQLAFVKE